MRMKDDRIPTPPPAWDASDPCASLLARGAWLNDQARRTFLQDGTHIELVMLLRADGEGGVATPPPGMSRAAFGAALRGAIKNNDIYGVLHVSEAWTYFPRQPNDHTFRQVQMGEIAVSQLRPEDRTEALTVHLEARDQTHRLWIHPIRRGADGTTLDDAREFQQRVQGNLGDLFAG